MTVFTPQAFAYYLPAYLIGDINEPEISDVLGDSLMFHLSPRHRPQKSEQIKALLSAEQKKAVQHYFEYVYSKENQRVFEEEYQMMIDFFRS